MELRGLDCDLKNFGPRLLRSALVLASFGRSGMKLQRARDEAEIQAGGRRPEGGIVQLQ